MNRLGKRVFFTACSAALLLPQALAHASQTIYKLIDAQGRVTYANTPIVGGVRVDLEPITLIPPSPSGSLVNANLLRPIATTSAALAPIATPTAMPTSSPTVEADNAVLALARLPIAATEIITPTQPVATSAPIEVAIVKPILNPTIKRLPIPASMQQQPLATDLVQHRAQQHRDEIKLRMMQSAVDSEQKLLSAALAVLAEERGASEGVRAIKASFNAANNDRDGSTNKMALVPVITYEARAKVERHFERVRDLQDQIAMHEKNLEDLRSVLTAETSAVRLASANMQ